MYLLLLSMKMLINWCVIRKSKRPFFNQLFGCKKVNWILNGILNKKDYALKMMLLRPKLAANARVVFKLGLLLATTLTYHALKT